MNLDLGKKTVVTMVMEDGTSLQFEAVASQIETQNGLVDVTEGWGARRFIQGPSRTTITLSLVGEISLSVNTTKKKRVVSAEDANKILHRDISIEGM